MTSASHDQEERIYRAVMRIPRGRVATYGQIARVAGLPRHHRQVGRALRHLLDDGLVPWHRVLDASGRISPRSEDGTTEARQRRLLEEEGVVFDEKGRVPLARFQWARLAREPPQKTRAPTRGSLPRPERPVKRRPRR
jgi:methylated-DNA-protein-cysteine methyltransferase-like protein